MEEAAKTITIVISHSLEIAAAVVIASALLQLGITVFSFRFKTRNSISAVNTRIQFGSAVAVSLELLLGADVLATAVAPTWDEIGKLAAIATIRTVLNFFLEKELKHTTKPG